MTGTPKQGWASTAGLFTLPHRQQITADSMQHWIAISEVFARYGMAHDEIDIPAMGDVFAEDGILEVSIAGPVFERHVGRAAIMKNFKFVTSTQSDQRRHAISNLEISMSEDSRAEARAYGIVTSADSDGIRLAVSCVYTAELVYNADGLWYFARLWIGMDIYTGRAPGTDEGEKNA
ncbi:MAG: nuclear transport factor 2 family protein [Alphaproteobacteria bacterium]|nr:nuclear transport factor 2 family protein [Alphaproteobacteria bacterium]